ncbi:type II secretion system F family protein [Candidatus Roizmanbacteria bacterium]|nr:type II secretion system F family protein [Candidatus Roizmanbacteria bacterium]
MQFRYRALKGNKVVVRTMEAESTDAVLRFLKDNGLFPIDVGQANANLYSHFGFLLNQVSFSDIVDFTRQIAIMLNAGLTLLDSFSILKKQITRPSLLKMIEDIDKEIRSGSSFSDALKKYRQHFSNLYIALVSSGEASGKLSDILLRLSDNLEKQRELKGKLKGALIYPVIVVFGMFAVMFVMVTFVVPKLLTLYKDFGVDLPFTTKILITVSGFSARFWPVIVAAAVGLTVAFRAFLATARGKNFKDTLILKIPVVSRVVKISALVDTTRTLSILIGSGVSILDSINIVSETSDNGRFEQAFKNIYKQVEKGISLGNAMVQEKVFPPILVQMTMVGEQTGHLDETLGRIAKYFELESEIAMKAMTVLIEPLILVVLGTGVGFLVISVLTPIYNLTNSLK